MMTTNQFYDYLKIYIGCDGDRLIQFFQRSPIVQFLAANPASAAKRLHHAYNGGWLVHTLEVIQGTLNSLSYFPGATKEGSLLVLCDAEGQVCFRTSLFQIVAAAALHDLNKLCDLRGSPFYVANMLKSGKRSDAIPWKRNDQAHCYWEGLEPFVVETQRYLLQIALEDQVLSEGAISLAMVRSIDRALFDLLEPATRFAIQHHDGPYGPGRRVLAGRENPLQLALHFADMLSSRLKPADQAMPDSSD